ncbi:MAG: hypothetical protein HY902_13030 [Deltaproteobacteria bacterium]|nr:hypothetical protein [Deltaproteobacteria bacterium]
MTNPMIGVVTNPNSRKNRLNPGRYEQMRETVGPLGLVRRTQDVTAIAEVVREFLDVGVRYFVADGGDGAFHWLMNVVMEVLAERPGTAWPAILPTNAGTIDFIGRKAGVVGHCDTLLPALVRRIRNDDLPTTIDLTSCHLRGTYGPDADRPGKPFEKLGFACALAGVAQRFFDKFYAGDQQDAAGIAMLVGKIILSQATRAVPLKWLPIPVEFRYFAEPVFEPLPAQVWLDGELLPIPLFRDLDVGSIDINLANVFRCFPYAAEGRLLHVQCGDISAPEIVRNLPRVFAGKTMEVEGFVQQRAQSLKVVPLQGRALDPVIDGELFWGLSELEVTVGPQVPVVQLVA